MSIPADADPDQAESAIRMRLRGLIVGGLLPRTTPPQYLRVAHSDGTHSCTGCGIAIDLGETEFQMSMPVQLLIFFHHRCFDLWTQEAALAAGEA